MLSAPFIFSLIFFFVSFIYCFFGIYLLYLNPRKAINRVFFLMCFSLFLWAFGFSIATSATNIETCLIWRRISAVGWGSFFSFVIYYFIILSEKEYILKKWWSKLLIIPGLITIYIFAISNEHAKIQYKFMKSEYGWTNIAINNGWDLFFFLYYMSYMIIGFSLLIHWRLKNNDLKIKKQATIVLISFIVALFTGTITDIIGNSVLSLNIPQIAPIVMLIPVIAVYYSMRKYQFMNVVYVNDDELILNEMNKYKIYKYTAMAFIAGSFMNYISQYMFYKNLDLQNVLIYSGLLLLIGLGILYISYSSFSDKVKSSILMIIFAASVPLLTLKFINFGGITIWAFPFLLITISLLLNKPRALFIISLSSIITQIVIWIHLPKVIVLVDNADYITRIGLFIINIWLAFFINKIYRLRLKENAEQAKLQKLITEVSSSFVSINMTNFNEKIYMSLNKCGDFFHAERTSLVMFDMSTGSMSCNHEWNYSKDSFQKIQFEHFTIDKNIPWIHQLLQNQLVYIKNNSFDNESDQINQITGNPFNETALIPLTVNKKVTGFLEFSFVISPKNIQQNTLEPFIILSNVFGDTITKINAEKEINHLAYYDGLTSLPNRVLFKDRVTQALNLAERTKKIVGVVYLDIDSFKTINDTLGHMGGDELLLAVSKRLLKTLRKSDTVCRYGGDEFIILLNNIANHHDITKITEKIMSLFKQSFVLKGQEFNISASAGISIYPTDGSDSDTLMKNADISMYKAKELGKNQYVLCSEKIKEEINFKTKLTNSLFTALENHELYVLYQPQIEPKSEKIIGIEALVRWKHPEFGVISPAAFIPLAEKSGLIQPIGEMVLETACRQNKKWQEMGLPKIRIAVNLSVQQFRNPNLVKLVARILKKTKLEPSYLELEITESIAINEENYIISVINDLRNLGVSISIDDFGTEYSSLSRLKILPIDRIKIDMQFIRGIEENEKDRSITEIIINLAKKLGLSVIAEGVETKKQLDFLSEMQCDEVQGYYFYKPLPDIVVEEILRSGSQEA